MLRVSSLVALLLIPPMRSLAFVQTCTLCESRATLVSRLLLLTYAAFSLCVCASICPLLCVLTSSLILQLRFPSCVLISCSRGSASAHSHLPVVFSLYLFLGIPSTGSCGLLNTIYSFTDESKRSKSPARSAAFPLFF